MRAGRLNGGLKWYSLRVNRFVALVFTFAIGCPRHERTTATETQAAASASNAPSGTASVASLTTSAATHAPPPPVANDCKPDEEAQARVSLGEATKAAAAKNWPASIKGYDDTLAALGTCTGPLKARALGERGYVKLRAKDLDGARVDLTGARDVAADDDLLGAIHFNLALLADAKKNSDDGYTETALSLGFRPNAAVRSRLSPPCGIDAVDGEQPGVRYATAADACKALHKSCGTDAGAAAVLGLCADDATALPCVSEGEQTSDVPWPDEISGAPVAAGAQSLFLVTQEGDALWVYPAGSRVLNWRCGGANAAVVKTSGSVIVVTYTGVTGAAGGGPGLSCAGTGYDMSSYAAISTKRHTTAASFSVVSLSGRLACRH